MMQEIVKVRGVLTTYLALTPSPSPQGEGSKTPSPNHLPRERASESPPSPWGEGGWGDEGDTVAGKLRQVPRALLERARELRSTQTATEQIFWECLRDRRLNNFKFRRQHNIGQYIADFYCHEARLVIELDGGIHQTQTDRDSERDDWMQSQNLRVLRFTNEQVLESLETVLQTILDTLTPSPSPQGEGSRTPPSPQGEGGKGDEGRSAYAFKRHAIQSSIYGVDIDPGAVDIAKLRLWLSLVVDEEDYTRIKPLPNLDYKIVCGNSLLGVDQRGEVKQYQGNVLNYQQLEQLDQLMLDFFDETNSERKTQLNREIKSLIQTLIGRAETFDFRIYFSEVFRKNHGFDVVIGNPPYVRQEQIKHLKDQLKPHYESFTGTADLYVFFYEKGLNLLREQGVLTYISSNKWFRAAYGKKLRQLISRETQLQQIIDFGDAPVFAAIAYPTIVIAQKGKPSSPNPFSLGAKGSKTNPVPLSLGRGARGEGNLHALNWQPGQSISQFETVVKSQSFAMPQQALTAEGWQFANTTALNLLDKLRKAGTPLGEYVNNRFYYGIKTGFNEAFVVDRTTRDRLIAEHPSSTEVLKPFLRGRDVKRWTVDYQDLRLLFIPWHFPLHLDAAIEGASEKAERAFKQQYPAIYNHLLNYKTELSNRNKAETGIRYEWYALQRCAATYWQEFERSKIFIPAIAQSVEYAADSSGYYGNDKTNICVTDEVEFLLGILNSKLMWWFIQADVYNPNPHSSRLTR